MRKFGIYGGFTTALTLCSLLQIGTAHADLSINPYPDVVKEAPAAVAVPAPEVEAMVTSPADTEFTPALAQAAMMEPETVESFDINAYYARFNDTAPIPAQAAPEAMVKISNAPQPLAPETINTDDPYAADIAQAKQDLRQLQAMAQTELEQQASQLEILRAEKAELEYQAAQVATLQAEKADIEQQAVEALRTKNATLEQQSQQMAALQAEKSELENRAAQIQALRTEKNKMEKQAIKALQSKNASIKKMSSQMEMLRAEKSQLEQQAAQVNVLRAEKERLMQKAAQLDTLRAEKDKMAMQQAAEAETLRVEKAALEKRAADADMLRAQNASLEVQASKVASLRAEKAAMENKMAEMDSLKAENITLAQKAAQLENVRDERATFEVKAAEAEVLEAEKMLLARQLQLAQQDYQEMSVMAQKASVLANENETLKQNMANMASSEQARMAAAEEKRAQVAAWQQAQAQMEVQENMAAEQLANIEPTSGNPGELYARASSVDAYAPPAAIHDDRYREPIQWRARTDEQAATKSTNMPDWRAPKGMSIRDVLGYWSRQEQVDFVWNTENQFHIDKEFQVQGNYEDAVAELLGQYTDAKRRPVASLHVDPQNGQRVLVVQTSDES